MVGLNGTILQGLCTLAFAAKTVTDWVGDPGKLKKIRCRFSAPVMMEDTISIQGTVADIQAGQAKVNLKVINQTGAEVLQNVEVEVKE
jgi:acyl dehydratase